MNIKLTVSSLQLIETNCNKYKGIKQFSIKMYAYINHLILFSVDHLTLPGIRTFTFCLAVTPFYSLVTSAYSLPFLP